MPHVDHRVLQYVKNTAGNATRAHFDDDNDPVGPWLWELYHTNMGLIELNPAGKVVLTDKGTGMLNGTVKEIS